MKHIVIIGGGASGLIAAHFSKSNNNKVTILERNTTCGKKILATGNGKCNYWNQYQELSHYNSENKELISEIITEKNKSDALNYFYSLGIYPKIKNGYYYPFSNQATTIKNALINNLKDIEIKNDFLVTDIIKKENYFEIHSQNEIVKADKVIIATGSKASPKTGSDGMGYKFLRRFGHSIIEPLPALVQLHTTSKSLKEWSGIRTDVKVSLYENGSLIKEQSGEIQLTDYGISGICVFNLTHQISRGLYNNKKEIVKINFLPFLEENKKENLEKIFNANKTIKEQLNGILNDKLVNIILNELKINAGISFNKLSNEEQERLIKKLTEYEVEVIKTNSFDQAQVCAGGIPLTEINPATMESKLVKDLYIVGELLDVDGECGGYNLTFAWITGMLAGKDCSIC